MTAPQIGVCESWATEADLCSPCDDYEIGDISPYLESASDILYQLSAQQFPGECEETVRLCTTRFFSGNLLGRSLSAFSTFSTISICGCTVPDRCNCFDTSQVVLPRTVNSISEVTIEGAVVPASAYRVDDFQLLVRTDGESWPCCSDSFFVTYLYGLAPPPSGIKAAAVLACELFLACQPEEINVRKCRLPRNTVQVVRQGIAIVVQAVAETLVPIPGRYIRTGIPEIDMFLAAYNRYGLTSPAEVRTPDIPPAARRVNTGL